MEALAALVTATRTAYRHLVAGADTAEVYDTLTDIYAHHGLDRNVAESSVDWYEGGTLDEDLADALKRKENP